MEENNQLFDLVLKALKENQKALESIKSSLPEERGSRLEHSISMIENYVEEIQEILSPGSKVTPTVSDRL